MSSNIDWNDTIKKEAEGINGEDFGEVQDVSNGFVLVQKGIINKERFLIPQELAESYDGDIVRFRISEDDIKSKYREDSNTAANAVETQSIQDVSQSESETEQTIPLTEERLEVSKNVQEQQATITKEPMTETKTMEVPVTHEEISIERRQPTGDTSTSQEPITSREDIEIPLKSEEVEVSKTPYVKEEAEIRDKLRAEEQIPQIGVLIKRRKIIIWQVNVPQLTQITSIKLFCEMADISIPWKKISRGLPNPKMSR